MAITSTQSKQPADTANVAVGRYITSSTAAAFKITTGFKPRYVKVVNLTASTGLVMVEWYEGMTAGTALKTDINGGMSIISTLGITVAADGFTVGLDTDLNVINEQLSWIATG
jgi:hypothetical protein